MKNQKIIMRYLVTSLLLLCLPFYFIAQNEDLKLDTFDFDEIVDLAFEKLDKNKFSEVIDLANRLIELDSQDYIGHSLIVKSKAGLGLYKEALIPSKKAVELFPHESTYYERGLIFYYLHSYNLALINFTKSISLDSTYYEAYVNKGVTNYFLKNDKKALMDFDKAIMLEPTRERAYYFRGILYDKYRMTEMAIQDFSNAIKYDSLFISSYYERGKTYIYNEQYGNGIKDLEVYLSFENTNSNIYLAHFYIGIGKILLKEFEEAKVHLSNSKEIDNKFDFSKDDDFIYVVSGYFDDLVFFIEDYIKKDEKSLDSLYFSLADISIDYEFDNIGDLFLNRSLKYNINYLPAKFGKTILYLKNEDFDIDIAINMFDEIINSPSKSDYKIYSIITQSIFFIHLNYLNKIDMNQIENLLLEIKNKDALEDLMDEFYLVLEDLQGDDNLEKREKLLAIFSLVNTSLNR